jgi:hypothetical protein
LLLELGELLLDELSPGVEELGVELLLPDERLLEGRERALELYDDLSLDPPPLELLLDEGGCGVSPWWPHGGAQGAQQFGGYGG